MLSPLLYLTALCLLRRILALCGFPHRGAVYMILALDAAPHTSLATFVLCPSRVRGVTCNILVWLPPYPHLFMFCVLRHRRTPYASGRAGAGVLHVCVHGVSYLRYVPTVARFVTYLLSPCLHLTVLCLLRRYLALLGISHTCFSAAGGVVVVCVCYRCTRHGSTHLSGHLCSLSFQPARRDM